MTLDPPPCVISFLRSHSVDSKKRSRLTRFIYSKYPCKRSITLGKSATMPRKSGRVFPRSWMTVQTVNRENHTGSYSHGKIPPQNLVMRHVAVQRNEKQLHPLTTPRYQAKEARCVGKRLSVYGREVSGIPMFLCNINVSIYGPRFAR